MAQAHFPNTFLAEGYKKQQQPTNPSLLQIRSSSPKTSLRLVGTLKETLVHSGHKARIFFRFFIIL